MVRRKQKGVVCSIMGCDNWCVSNNLCAKHNMQERRKQESYKNYIKQYNKRYKRPDINKVCDVCQAVFVTARASQNLCSTCSGSSKGNYAAQKKHRASHPERVKARDMIGKRISRGALLTRGCCSVCGKDNAHAHHDDYSKPLDITWLCKDHHYQVHRSA